MMNVQFSVRSVELREHTSLLLTGGGGGGDWATLHFSWLRLTGYASSPSEPNKLTPTYLHEVS